MKWLTRFLRFLTLSDRRRQRRVQRKVIRAFQTFATGGPVRPPQWSVHYGSVDPLRVLSHPSYHFPQSFIFYNPVTMTMTREQRYLYSKILAHYAK